MVDRLTDGAADVAAGTVAAFAVGTDAALCCTFTSSVVRNSIASVASFVVVVSCALAEVE